jgi:hypothetical protein
MREQQPGLNASAGRQWFVATNGNDAWSGHLPSPNSAQSDGPLATLGEARQRIRDTRKMSGLPTGATVQVRGGRYELTATLYLTREDSGAPGAPIVYRSYGNERVIISGGRAIDTFEKVADPDMVSRLDESARGNVWQADLSSAGVTDVGDVTAAGQRPELLFRDVPMTLARWPNVGFAKIESVVGGKPLIVRGVQGDSIGRFTYDGERPTRWVKEEDAWLHGYWFWDWADSYQKVRSIDPARHLIDLAPPFDPYGYRQGQRFYALNLLAELDSPGEWYLDRTRKTLYFWPPSDIRTGDVTLSVLPTLISMKSASWVSLQGLILEATRSTIIQIDDGSEDSLAGCVLRDTSGWAVSISGGTHSGVVGCDISQTGEGGISLAGGDRHSLSPADHYAENNHIWKFGRFQRTYRPAVNVSGVGMHIAHNLIHDGPHDAIQLSGNDHLIEWNEVHDVAQETDDVGAFYMGRDWTARGTVIRYNYFHDLIGAGRTQEMAVYLDDASSGITVYGNLFYRAGQAVLIGGGRDNVVQNNVFVECTPSIHVDARGLGWMRDLVENDGTLPRLLRATPYQTPPWSARYPRLSVLLDDQPGAPKGNVVIRNISVGGRWLDIDKAAEPFVHIAENLVGQDPKFVDAAARNFQLRSDSPAFALGFERIPLERIGLYSDESRAGLAEKER